MFPRRGLWLLFGALAVTTTVVLVAALRLAGTGRASRAGAEG
jgi:hypothetical protein